MPGVNILNAPELYKGKKKERKKEKSTQSQQQPETDKGRAPSEAQVLWSCFEKPLGDLRETSFEAADRRVGPGSRTPEAADENRLGWAQGWKAGPGPSGPPRVRTVTKPATGASTLPGLSWAAHCEGGAHVGRPLSQSDTDPDTRHPSALREAPPGGGGGQFLGRRKGLWATSLDFWKSDSTPSSPRSRPRLTISAPGALQEVVRGVPREGGACNLPPTHCLQIILQQ